MIAAARRQEIVKLLEKESTQSVKQIQSYLGVSLVTVYRDLKSLEEEGLVERVRGGARLLAANRFEERFRIRVQLNLDKKTRIAVQASKYVQNGDCIFVDASSTGFLFAQKLVRLNVDDLVVITNSAMLMAELLGVRFIHVTCTGGDLLGDTGILVGPYAVDFIRKINVNKAFVGCTGVSVTEGISYGFSSVAELIQALIGSSKEVNVLVDSTKFGKAATVSIGPVSLPQQIFTDDGLPAELVREFEEAGARLILC